jgi:NADH-quinone oxidoreductase subunit L
VSALIHAATMVTAGVYLMTRVNPILAAGYDWVPDVIAWVGAITALIAATIAIAQNDIKKVLAYSTVSQLGYMFLAVGIGAYVAAIFHMVTHAFFKALLFLGSGSVIHGIGGDQDMRHMGGLRKYMPLTCATFIVGWLSIAGVPPFSGFWSKDEILTAAWASPGTQGKVLWAIGLVTALITAYYMSRQVYMVFYGARREAEPEPEPEPETLPVAAVAADAGGHGHGHAGEPHESPWIMTLPLVVLAVLATIGGGLNLPFGDDLHVLEHWLEPVVGENELPVDLSGATQAALIGVAVLVALVGIATATQVYLRRRVKAREPEVLAHAYYYDEGVTRFVGGPGTRIFQGVAWFDAHVVDGAVNGVAHVVAGFGRRLRHVQSGFVRTYALGVATGVVVVLGYFLTRIRF